MKKKIWILISLCILLIPGSIIWCFTILSKSNPELFCISDWGNFGSFVSGTVGLLIALFNLVAFIFLTLEVSKLQKDFNSQQINIQNEINQRQLEFQKKTILTQLRNERISEISNMLNEFGYNLLKLIRKYIYNPIGIYQLKIAQLIITEERRFNSFTEKYQNLFNGIEMQKFDKEFSDLSKLTNTNSNVSETDFLKIYYEFDIDKNEFIRRLSEIMLNEINT